MKRYILFISLGLLLFSMFSFGQIGMEQWRTHVPYLNGGKVVIVDNDIYMTTEINLLKYSKSSGEMESISKITGLNDSDIRSVNYHKKLDHLVIGYGNGNIDIITGNNIFNISDIKRKLMNSDKAINSILFIDDIAYLSCGFGIVVLDLKKREIRETWFIGNNGSFLNVNELVTDGNNIYAATDRGVYKGNLSETLVDFSKWEIISNNDYGDPSFSWMSNEIEQRKFNTLIWFSDKLIVNYQNSNDTLPDSLLVYNGNSWSHVSEDIYFKVKSLNNSSEFLIISADYQIGFLAKDFSDYYGKIYVYRTKEMSYNVNPSFVIPDDENKKILWIADSEVGLVRYNIESNSSEIYELNGPESYDIFDMTANNKYVYGVGGGMDLTWLPTYNAGKIYRFNDERWVSKSWKNSSELTPYFEDFVRIVADPKDPDHYFCASWGRGLFEYRDNTFYKIYDNTNTDLKPVVQPSHVRVGGLAFDNKNNLWITNTFSSVPIHVLTPDGTWHGIDYSSVVSPDINIGNIIITQDNNKWVVVKDEGLFVFNDNGTLNDRSDDKHTKMNVVNENGELISKSVFSIAEDKNGYIWVGTNAGVAIYYTPEDVFKTNISARQIKIPKKDNPNEADIFLGNETVTMILVDGANKKWFGTQSGGVYYTSYNGEEEIFHFIEDNSPLPSNNILCGTIDPQTGEVFFGTSKGIVSYRNVATEGGEDYSDVYAFPNPVRPDYDGPITITGLVADSYVKITDISGNIVYEVKSEGGQAVWYGRDLNGTKVKTGIYLVFSGNDDASKTNIAKIMFIN